MNKEQSQGGLMDKVSLTASSKLTIAALVGMAAVELIGVLILEGKHPPIALVIELLLLGACCPGRYRAVVGLCAGGGVKRSFCALVPVLFDLDTAESRIPEFISAVVFLGWRWSPRSPASGRRCRTTESGAEHKVNTRVLV